MILRRYKFISILGSAFFFKWPAFELEVIDTAMVIDNSYSTETSNRIHTKTR